MPGVGRGLKPNHEHGHRDRGGDLGLGVRHAGGGGIRRRLSGDLGAGLIMRKITIEELHRLFSYDPETGVLRHRISGSVGSRHHHGYVQFTVGGTTNLAHRIAWEIHYGPWPPDCIDHVNGIRDDNRISNLRLATVQQNCFNRSQPISKTSGVRGVSWSKSRKKWYAQIKRFYKSYSLGYYDSIEEASVAYRKAAMEFHGEFSVLLRESRADV